MAITAITFHLSFNSSDESSKPLAVNRKIGRSAVRGIVADFLDQAESVQLRHLAVGYKDVGHLPLDGLPSRLAVAGDTHVVAGLLQLELGRPQDVNLVVAEENAFHG